MKAAVLRYRVMAYIVGVGLLLLVGVAMPLRYGAGEPGMVMVLGPIHGLLYIVYLLAALDLGRRAQFTVLEMLAVVAAGLFPFLAFYVERRMTERLAGRVPA